MQRFDVKFDQRGNMLMPKQILTQVRDKKMVMVFDEGEIRIMSSIKYRNMTEA